MRVGIGSQAGVAQPPRQLRGFERLALRNGASAQLTFALTARDLAWWDVRARAWRIATGCYAVLVGGSSRDLQRSATIAVGDALCQRPAVRLRQPTQAAAAASVGENTPA